VFLFIKLEKVCPNLLMSYI